MPLERRTAGHRLGLRPPPPGYSWYALLLIALVALDGHWELLGIPLAGAAVYILVPTFDYGAVLADVV